jgi:plasmid stability protein
MGTITIRRLDDAVIEAIKRRAADAGRSMEEEARQALQQAYPNDQMKRQREFAMRLREMHARGLLPKGHGVDSADIIREMREERDQQLSEAIEGRRAPDR